MSQQVSQMIKKLYQITTELERMYPGRCFTPDGHLVGSIGEVLVADAYGLSLLENSSPIHDAVAADGRLVQIKATQVNRVALSSEPDYLIVIQLNEVGGWQEIYNGPGKLAWDHAGKMQKNGQRQITLSKLSDLMLQVDSSMKIPEGGGLH